MGKGEYIDIFTTLALIMLLVYGLHITIIYFNQKCSAWMWQPVSLEQRNRAPHPLNQPHISHLIFTYFIFNLSISTFCPITHQHLLTIPTLPLALTMDMPHHWVSHHVTESHLHTSASMITWCPQSHSWRVLDVLE